MTNNKSTEILVVGGGTGGTAAALQAARKGAQVILVSEFPWLGGMLTSAGVAAPDGNELLPLQTGIWGAYIRELQQRTSEGLDQNWVSLFGYNPPVGAEVFADWVADLPNLQWLRGQTPQRVIKQENRVVGVEFEDYEIFAKITLDGTELGDLLALGEISHRWGWELQGEYNEPSAPTEFNELTERYPVQSPTWVFLLQDYGENNTAPPISAPKLDVLPDFEGAWQSYGLEKFLNYGRLPGGLFMINWPQCGNDYGRDLNRLIGSEQDREAYHQEAFDYSLSFAYYLQKNVGDRYGIAQDIFPNPQNSGFALHPYYRESRRLQGLQTMTEQDLLPQTGGYVASLPVNQKGEISSIATGNYANDHHYPGVKYKLQPKSMRWGGRWTGTPFSIPYECLIPASIDGFLVCEKNISVSHIANGSTRLQPTVLNLGQAAGMAAALCIELGCQPRDLSPRQVQEGLLRDTIAPSAVIPLLNLPPNHPQWLHWQQYYLDNPAAYPLDGCCPLDVDFSEEREIGKYYTGMFRKLANQGYSLQLQYCTASKKSWALITTSPTVKAKLENCQDGEMISVWGCCNYSGGWLVVYKLCYSATAKH
jgi:hypothetical protein